MLWIIDSLTDEQAWKLIKKMKSYHNGNSYVINDPIVEMAFNFFKIQFDRDNKKYQAVCERNKANGLKWWRPKANKYLGYDDNQENPVGYLETQINPNNPSEPKKPDNDNDKDNDKDKTTNVVLEADDFSSLPDKEIKYQLNYNWKSIWDLLSLFVEKKIISSEYFSSLDLKEIEEHIIEKSLLYLSGFKKEATWIPELAMTDEEYERVNWFKRPASEAIMKSWYWCEDWREEQKRLRKEWESQSDAVWYTWSNVIFELLEKMLERCDAKNVKIKNFKSTYTNWAKPKDFKK